MKVLQKECPPEELIERLVKLTGKSREAIYRQGKKSIERAMLMELLYRLCHVTQTEIGGLGEGIDYSAVSQARKRLRTRLEKEPKTKIMFKNIRNRLCQLSKVKGLLPKST
ncbi:MAG: hypothetical protein RAO92_08635, partial [Candidatus Euphemobacter frigidus]|nr:hypothetical protein [Candidatus Euphemobacter frigidus]MDP8276453.1 hypothetical protein [Candidatus Euphemobacter frigidus]